MEIAADTFCNVCDQCPADTLYMAQPMCYPCRINSARESWAIDNAQDAAAENVECDCNADKACVYCIDGELYGTITTTQQGQLPAPPPFILLDNVWNEEDERAMHALTHCEDEQSCTFCNQ